MKSVAKVSAALKAMKKCSLVKATPEKAPKPDKAKTSSDKGKPKISTERHGILRTGHARLHAGDSVTPVRLTKKSNSSPTPSSCSTPGSEDDKKAALIAKIMSMRKSKEEELTAKTKEVRTLKRKATDEENQNPNLDGEEMDEDDAPHKEEQEEQTIDKAKIIKDDPGTSPLGRLGGLSPKVGGLSPDARPLPVSHLSATNVAKVGGMSLNQKMEKMQAAFAAGEGIQSERKESSVINGFLKQFENEMFLGNCFKCFCCIWNVTVFPLSPGFLVAFCYRAFASQSQLVANFFFTLKEALNNWH